MLNPYFYLKGFAKTVKSLYFKQVHVVGLENVPLNEPVILCGNHANQFIDPIMIASLVDREISFTIAASSFSKPVVGQMAKAVNAIPVKRPEDSKVKGSGNISFLNSTTIKGENTLFISETAKLATGWCIFFKNKMINIKKIVDDTTIEILENQDVKEFIGKSYSNDKYFVRLKYYIRL